MSEFNIRSESIDVEQLMEQIRTRIREKRGVDYTEQQVQQLAAVKLEQFLDPKHVRSDLLDHYRRRMADLPDPEGDVPASPPLFEFDRDTIYRSSRGVVGRVLFGVRRLLRPVLKLFFNPTPVVHALHTQQQINAQVTAQVNWMMERSEQIAAKLKTRAELDALTYELLNNLVVEMTRLSIDVKNHKMQVESIAGRLDFDERRARALESVVEYRTQVAPARDGDSGGEGDETVVSEKRKRRRRRGRRRSSAKTADPPASEAGGAGEEVVTEAPDAGRTADGASGAEQSESEVAASEPPAGPAAGDAGADVTAESPPEASGARNGDPDPGDPTSR
ncbi:MAG: hypothetical protein J4F37_04575 [Acidobacteria bacterium]|nr:hypothetical protein [Acidobacteriota bacterium]